LQRDASGRFDRGSQIRPVRIQQAAWNGGQHGWAKPCRMDLRERAVAAVEIGTLSCRQATAQFGIGVSTRRLSGRGTWVRPAALRRGRWADTGRRPFPVSTRAWLLERVKLRDFALRGLVAECGLEVDDRAVWTFIHAEKLSFKKPWWPASAIAPTSHTAGCSGASIKTASSLSVWSSSRRLVFIETWN
jgi:putative transposase